MTRFTSAFAIFIMALMGLGASVLLKVNGCFGLEWCYTLGIGIDLALIAVCINFFVALVAAIVSGDLSCRFWQIIMSIETLLVCAGMIGLYLLPPLHPQILIPFLVGFVLSAAVGWATNRSHIRS